MGTLIGHVGPGFGLFVIGLWHLYNNLKLLAQKGSSAYNSRPWFPSSFKNSLLRRLELHLIISVSTLSAAMELFIGPEKHQPLDTDGTIPWNHLHNFEHTCISLSFLVYALFALALDKWTAKRPIPAQRDVLQLVSALPFSQQLLLVHLHSTDHTGVEGQYHWLLQLVIFVSLVTTLLGIDRGARSFTVAFVRSLSIMFQGVWTMVMGFALWTPGLIARGCFIHEEEGHEVVRCDGDKSLHRAKALVNIQFSWFFILLAVFSASFYAIMIMVYGNANIEYKAMSSINVEDEEEEEEEEEDVEAHKINTNFTETQTS